MMKEVGNKNNMRKRREGRREEGEGRVPRSDHGGSHGRRRAKDISPRLLLKQLPL